MENKNIYETPISGCEIMKCKYYVGGKCNDPNEWVNEDGDYVCGLRNDAILVQK